MTPDTKTLERFRSTWEKDHSEWYTDYQPLVHKNDEHTRSQFSSIKNTQKLNTNTNEKTNVNNNDNNTQVLNYYWYDNFLNTRSGLGLKNNGFLAFDDDGKIASYKNIEDVPNNYHVYTSDELSDYQFVLDDKYNLVRIVKGGKVAGSSVSLWSRKFATGGLVDFTGPAWVDGTPSKPEAFLSAEDTRNIQTLTEILNTVITSATSPASVDRQETKAGDTSIEMHINVEGINESDEDWEETAQRVGEIFADSVKNQVHIVNTTI